MAYLYNQALSELKIPAGLIRWMSVAKKRLIADLRCDNQNHTPLYKSIILCAREFPRYFPIYIPPGLSLFIRSAAVD